MRIVRANKNGELTRQMKQYFGGDFSFFEKLRIGGVGSANVIYNGGIPLLDDALREVEGELNFVNFEILKNGLLLRSNINQRTMCVGLKLDEIRSIKLLGFMPESYVDKNNLANGAVQIYEQDLNYSEFLIPHRNFENVLAFFQKKIFRTIFNYAVRKE